MISAMDVVGEKFKNGEIFVPEMLIAAKAMKKGVEVLKPHLATGAAGALGKVVIGTVAGDLHDIGKNLVKIMMEGAGLDVIDLGCDIPAEDFVQAAIDNDCRIIACSTLLTTCMDEIRTVVQLARERGIRDNVKILIGGAPVSPEFCESAGADLYTPDAAAAARAAVQMLAD
jgi:methylmalonyl-CoA mutase cobalamin-binding domain/chain